MKVCPRFRVPPASLHEDRPPGHRGPKEGARFEFDQHETLLVGRGSGARLRLSGDRHFSRRHFSRFDAPAAQVPPLVELLSCQRLDQDGWFEPLDLFALQADPARYRRAWLAWRGLDDDPAAQPAKPARSGAP